MAKRVLLVAGGSFALSCFLMAGSVGAKAQATPPPADVAKPAKTPAASPADQAARAGMLSQFNDSLQELTSRVSPAIVQIQVTGYRAVASKSKSSGDDGDDDDSAGNSTIGRQRSLGSGVIVDPDGYIITNAHVVKGAQRVRVQLTPPTDASDSQVRASLGVGDHLPPVDAKIVGIAPAIDLAVLKIDGKDLPSVPFADYTKLKKGQLVLAFGNPEGLENSVTMGIISAVARQADPANAAVYIQTDAPINPGSSGGPLVDTNGNLVGINTFILTVSGGSQGLGFAIPSSVVEFVYKELRKYGRVHRSVIGATLQEITPDLAAGLGLKTQHGVIVADVTPDGPADKAGLQVQDILLSLDGRPIGSVPLAEMIVSTRPVDAVVKVEALRGGQKISMTIPVTEQKNDIDQLSDLVNPEKDLVAKLGIFGVEIDDRLAKEVEDLREPSGVIVAALAADASGVEIDLQPGDVIHALNGKPVRTLDGLRSALAAMAVNAPGVLQIERDGKLFYITFEME
jgi:serine protease Do